MRGKFFITDIITLGLMDYALYTGKNNPTTKVSEGCYGADYN